MTASEMHIFPLLIHSQIVSAETYLIGLQLLGLSGINLYICMFKK